MSDYSDEQLYGDDLPRDARRWARLELGNEINELKAQVAQNMIETNRARVVAALDADPQLASKWRGVNDSADFVKWLNEVDYLSNIKRMQLFGDAYNNGDSWRVANFFKGFIASQIPERARTNERLPFEQSAKQPAVKPSGDRYAEKRRVWQPGEISRFYNDCRLGKYDGRQAERNQIEAEIIAAANQGRVADAAQQPRMPGRAPWE